MCKVGHRLAVAARTLIILILMSGMVWAQGSQPVTVSVRSQDVFEGWHASLNDAADKTLAAAVADKPWMKTPEVAAGAGGTASTTTIDPLVRVRAAIQRVQRLRPTIEPILRQEGVPAELSAIVLVESGGQITALSPKGARGVWQFMSDTARRYGLAVTAERDERVEVVKSTRAAGRYLRDLHQRFGDWQLAFAAYNAGEQAVEHAAARTGHRNFSSIQSALPQETRNYVPAVLNAMAILGSNPEGVLRAVNSSRSPNARLLYASAELPKPANQHLSCHRAIFANEGEIIMTSTTAVKDPVCGMDIETATAAGRTEYKGQAYYFCGPKCKEKFDLNPERCLGKSAATPKSGHGCCG